MLPCYFSCPAQLISIRSKNQFFPSGQSPTVKTILPRLWGLPADIAFLARFRDGILGIATGESRISALQAKYSTARQPERLLQP